MRYYITTRQNTPLIHHIICTENIGMDPVVPCLFDDFFAAFLTKSGENYNSVLGFLYSIYVMLLLCYTIFVLFFILFPDFVKKMGKKESPPR